MINKVDSVSDKPNFMPLIVESPSPPPPSAMRLIFRDINRRDDCLRARNFNRW